MPRCDEDPCGRERGHVFEVFPDVLRCPLQDFRICSLSVIHVTTDPIVHICPKWGDEGPTVAQRERLGRELADLHIKRDDTVVVDL